MIIVTGAAGFIGSNLILGLNQRGYKDILAVDHLKNGTKFKNLVDCQIMDYLDRDEFIVKIDSGYFNHKQVSLIFHQGACSATTEWDGQYMMENNYQYSKKLFHFCQDQSIPFIYASSAAVYGDDEHFIEDPLYEKPLNVYGYSKFQFDHYLRRYLDQLSAPVAGLRYFNVYGPREQHKGSMASVAFHLNNQLLENGVIKLFEGCDGYENGEQRRDFISVADVVSMNLWFMDNPTVSGIFNIGTGRSQTFNEVAQTVLDFHKSGKLEYIPFPDHLKGRYQSYTQANLDKLRTAGCQHQFMTVQEGVKCYMQWLNA